MKSILRYPGGKWSYAKWISAHLPPHKIYLEPYFGSGAVFFNKTPSHIETINDVDGLVVNFFRAVRDYPEDLARAINLTPFARAEFMSIQENHAGEDIQITGDCIEDARRFAVRCYQGFGSKLADRVGWKNSKSSTAANPAGLWANIPGVVIEAAQRLKNAQIECTDAIRLIKKYNAPDCLIYADPPYLGATRKNKRIYRKEMMDEQAHVELLETLKDHKGPAVLSGYDCELYNDILQGWHKAQKVGYANNSAQRVETVWMNYELQTRLVRE